MKKPPSGWTTSCKVDRVIDGDTVEFTVSRKMIGRLIDYDAPETYRPSSAEEKKHGEEATDYLEQILENADTAVHIVSNEDFKDIYSIGGRVQVYLFADGVDVSELMKSEGYIKKNDYESDE